jgi:hypothetical protein
MFRRLVRSAVVAVAVGASFMAAPLASAPLLAQSATFLGYTTSVPAGWSSATPSSSMRLAEYRVAGAAGAMPVEVVVYFFGPGQGGDPQANIDRWQSQFSNPDGSPVQAKITLDKRGPFPITFSEFRGTYARGVGAGSSADAARPNHLLLAAIVETPKGMLFVQCYGPIAAAEGQRAAFEGFVKGLK